MEEAWRSLKTLEEQIIGEDIYKHEVCDANHQLFEYNEIFYAFKSLVHSLILPVFDEHNEFKDKFKDTEKMDEKSHGVCL